jgi:hypothetical protein
LLKGKGARSKERNKQQSCGLGILPKGLNSSMKPKCLLAFLDLLYELLEGLEARISAADERSDHVTVVRIKYLLSGDIPLPVKNRYRDLHVP